MSTQTHTTAAGPTPELSARRVASRDGTQIGYRTSGDGPPLVLVHGATADHTAWAPLLPYLERDARVHAIDRRGRGTSGDAPDYDLAREFEDVAAVVDAVAEASGAAVDVFGHSFGALCALGAAASTPNVRKLVLYEPPVDPDADAFAGIAERLDSLLAERDREAVLVTFLREVAMLPEQAVRAFRDDAAWWQARLDAAHTIPREFRAPFERPFAAASSVTAPTLLLTGSDSAPYLRAATEFLAAALPNARVAVLEGQQHLAHVLVPEVVAERVLGFLRDAPSRV